MEALKYKFKIFIIFQNLQILQISEIYEFKIFRLLKQILIIRGSSIFKLSSVLPCLELHQHIFLLAQKSSIILQAFLDLAISHYKSF